MIALSNRWCRRVHPKFALLIPALIAFAYSANNPAAAQGYDQLNAKMGKTELRALRNSSKKWLRDASVYEAEKKQFDNYWGNYVFKKMTQYKSTGFQISQDLGLLGKRRQGLIKYLREIKVPAAQKRLTEISMEFGRVISHGNYHPAVRYNFALILGMLDDKYSTGSNPPVPHPPATLALVELLENDQFTVKEKTIKVIPSVKVAALVGLERHARFGISEKYAERVTKATLAVIANDQPDEEISKKVHHYMKSMAARVLSRQFKEGPTPEVQQALTQLIADEKMSLADRCSIAEQLKEMKYSSDSDLDVTATIVALGKLTQEVANVEFEEAEEFEEEALGGANFGRGGMRGGEFRGGGARGRNMEGPTYPRRRLLTRLACIYSGAKQLSKGLEEADKQRVDALNDAIVSLIKTAGEDKTLDLDVTNSIKVFKRTIDSIVGGWGVALNETGVAEAA